MEIIKIKWLPILDIKRHLENHVVQVTHYCFHHPVRMRDGAELSTITIRPEETGKYPTVLMRTPYNAKGFVSLAKGFLDEIPYAFVIQDVRGRYDSQGERFIPFKEKNDSLDTFSWIKKQPWSNGHVVVFGPSYLGYTALQVLNDECDSIDAVFAPMTFARPSEGLVYRSGVLQLHWALSWAIMTSTRVQASLKLINGSWPDAFKGPLKNKVKQLGWPQHVWDMFLSPLDNETWNEARLEFSEPVKSRICLIGGWYDFMLGATLRSYEDLLNAGGVKPDLIIGGWSHNGYLQSLSGVGDFDLGEQGKAHVIEDFSNLLKRTETEAEQLIRVYVLRSNKWLELEEWPPRNIVEEKLYLGGEYDLLQNPTSESVDFSIPADPRNPVPTIGGSVWEFPPHLEPGPADQSSLKNRPDILRFVSPPFDRPRTILGPINAELWVSTPSELSHFTSKLTLIEGDSERIIQDGIVPIEQIAETPTQVCVDLLATGMEIKKNERIGFEISWSNFPKYALSEISTPTVQQVHVSHSMPSNIRIPFLTE